MVGYRRPGSCFTARDTEIAGIHRSGKLDEKPRQRMQLGGRLLHRQPPFNQHWSSAVYRYEEFSHVIRLLYVLVDTKLDEIVANLFPKIVTFFVTFIRVA